MPGAYQAGHMGKRYNQLYDVEKSRASWQNKTTACVTLKSLKKLCIGLTRKEIHYEI